MGLDIRTPIGMLFLSIGLLLTGYGLISDRAIYRASLGININLGWGICLLIFGGVMLALGMRGARRMRQAPSSPAGDAPVRRGH
ncbi:MAG TPA: hypothetical protein VEG32_08995 [Clostridia bacterium]|nr:hypothetical protein [Clostridia bacterium]